MKRELTRIHATTHQSGFTQSEITMWDDCAQKWYYHYNSRLSLPGTFAWPFVYGNGVHATLEHFYLHKELKLATLQVPDDVFLDVNQQAKLEWYQGMHNVTMERYASYYKDDFNAWVIRKCEEEIEVEFEGVKLKGKIDMVFEDVERGLCQSDTKTSSRFDKSTYDAWEYRFQFMFYPWLYWKKYGELPRKMLVNAVKKSALRVGKNESLPSHFERIRAALIEDPSKYFQRVWLPLTASMVKEFERHILMPKIERIHLTKGEDYGIMELLTRNVNTNNCIKFGSACQFLPLCQFGESLERFRYRVRDTKHTELGSTEGDEE
jgi:hypothetical protein